MFNQSRLILLDEISDCDLNTLLNLAHIIVLPVGYGGGSALKTAQAIGSKCFVVSNNIGLRDFEEYIDNRKIYLCKKNNFKETIVKLLEKRKSFKKNYSELTWEFQLKIIDHEIRGIL